MIREIVRETDKKTDGSRQKEEKHGREKDLEQQVPDGNNHRVIGQRAACACIEPDFFAEGL